MKIQPSGLRLIASVKVGLTVGAMNYMLAAISGESVMWLVIQIVIIGLCYWIVDWGLSKVALPDPFSKIAQVVLVLAVVVFLVNALLSIGGHGFIKW